MNADLLITQFDRIAEVPDAVPRLRRFILDLAVRGRLVKSNYKNVDLRLEGCDIEWVSTVPENWQVNRLGSLITLEYGKAISKEERQGGAVPVYGSNGIIGYSESFLTNKPAIIIGRKGSAGSLNIADGPSWTSDVAYYVIPPPNYDIRFLYLMLSVLDLPNLAKGVKPGLNRNDVYDLVGVLPPLAEQHRIVAKVNALMTVCDELEVQQREREAQRDRTVMAMSHKLVHESPADQSLAKTVQFYLRNFADLTVRREHVQQWRRTILDLAVRGRLVEQDSEDEPIFSSLKVGREVVKGPYELPLTWQWHAVGDITTNHGQKVPDSDFIYIDVSAIDATRGVIESPQILRATEAPSRARRIVQFDDVIYSTVRPYLLNVAVIDQDYTLPAIASTAFVVLSGIGLTVPRYLWLVLRSPYFVKLVEEQMRGQAYPAINDRAFKELPIPLPPLAEQHRIVAKVNELMTVCDALEQQLSMQEQDAERFMEAVLHGMLTPVVQRI